MDTESLQNIANEPWSQKNENRIDTAGDYAILCESITDAESIMELKEKLPYLIAIAKAADNWLDGRGETERNSAIGSTKALQDAIMRAR